MKKILPVLFLALFTATSCYAGVWDSVQSLFDKSRKNYYIRVCNSVFEANSCNSGCTVVNANQYNKFSINRQEKFIIKTFYEGGTLVSQSVLENCKIIDSENWSCGKEDGKPVDMMNNGVHKWFNFCSK